MTPRPTAEERAKLITASLHYKRVGGWYNGAKEIHIVNECPVCKQEAEVEAWLTREILSAEAAVREECAQIAENYNLECCGSGVAYAIRKGGKKQ